MQWLFDHVDYTGNDCLRYPYISEDAINSLGGLLYEGKKYKTPRLMCHLRYGPPPTEKHEAAHSCGKRHEGCVNPNHLRWATPSENARDKFIHGTHIRGSKHAFAKLTEDDVRAIRKLIGVIPHRDIADRFDVTETTITNIKMGDSWGWLDNYAYPDPVQQAIEKAKREGSPFVYEDAE